MKISKALKNIILAEISIPIALLLLGIYHGLLQVIYRAGLLSQAAYAGLDYYQGLTLHGVINAIVLTTFFAVAFGHACMAYFLKKEPNIGLVRASMLLMLVGTVMAAAATLAGKASVLYTFYPPLKAHPTFYLGATLLVVGSWVAFYSWIKLYVQWKKENALVKTPLAVIGTLVNFTLWFVCTLSVAYEILVLLIPWSMGWTDTINVPLARTLFWFFGHALVYFWLLPAYTMFYTMLPKLAGGKLYSDLAGRIAFFIFLILSIPVGVHHQFGDPGVTRGIKMVQTILTLGVALPSFITAFTVAASLEYAGRKNGAKGLFGWIFKLPYFDKDRYLFAYLICGLILFIFGGFTGLVNASYSLNNMVHNTAFIPGHFHMTVAGPVFLAIIGMSIYLTEKLTGKTIVMPYANTLVPYLWTIGIFIFSSGLMWGGLLGEPRRTNTGMTYLNPESPLYTSDWVPTTTLALIGGIIMTLAFVLYFISFFSMLFSKTKSVGSLVFPVSDAYHDEPRIALLDGFKPWLVLMIIVILIAYIPAIMDVLNYIGPEALPYVPENPLPVK